MKSDKVTMMNDWPTENPNHIEEQLDYLKSIRIYPILCLLRQGFFHVTTAANCCSIIETGFIYPSGDPYGPQSQHRGSYAYLNNCVSLFDFKRPSPWLLLPEYEKWAGFIDREWPAVLIQIEEAWLAPRRIENEQAQDELHRRSEFQKLIEHFEVWASEAIPLSGVVAFYVITKWKPLRIFPFDNDEESISRLHRTLRGIETDKDLYLDPVARLIRHMNEQQMDEALKKLEDDQLTEDDSERGT